MSASEVIEQIKTLEPQERVRVLDHLLALQAGEDVGCVDDRSFDAAADRVVEKHAELLRKLAQ